MDHIPRLWIKHELALQRRKLRDLKKATQFGKMKSYIDCVNMREEIVAICEKYKDKL